MAARVANVIHWDAVSIIISTVWHIQRLKKMQTELLNLKYVLNDTLAVHHETGFILFGMMLQNTNCQTRKRFSRFCPVLFKLSSLFSWIEEHNTTSNSSYVFPADSISGYERLFYPFRCPW